MKFIKNLTMVLVAMLTFGAIATPAMACTGNACPPPQTPPPSTCAGPACPGTGGVVIDVIGGAGHVGDFRAMWNGTSGEAAAAKEGFASSMIGIDFDSCATTECPRNGRVTAQIRAGEMGETMAIGRSTEAGRWATAQNMGSALAGGQLTVTMVRPTAAAQPAPQAAPTGN